MHIASVIVGAFVVGFALLAAPLYWLRRARRLQANFAEARGLVLELRDALSDAAGCIAGEWGFDEVADDYALIERVDVARWEWEL